MKRPPRPLADVFELNAQLDRHICRACWLLLALLIVAACARRPYRPRHNAPSWSQRDRALEVAQPHH